MQFNLLTEKWIPTLTHDGNIDHLGILDALNSDHTQIACYSPLETFGVYRLLIAVNSDPEWLDSRRFDLCDDAPFMQTSDETGTRKPISYLTYDIPTGTNSIHFHHCQDSQQFFCAPCIARAMCAIPAWMTVGGKGLSPSINGAPPIYWLPVADTIRETIAINTSPYRDPLTPWRRPHGDYYEMKSADRGHALTFMARRVHVFWRNAATTCTRCGNKTSLGASEMIFAPGDRYIGNDWVDPHVIYGQKRDRTFPMRPIGIRADWQSFIESVWKNESIVVRPHGAKFQVFGAVTSKARFDDAFSVEFTNPLTF